MKQLSRYRPLAATALAVFAGCTAYPISKQYREEAQMNVTVPMVRENPSAYKGAVVIWGGFVLNDVNDSSGSTLTILETPLDYQYYPKSRSLSRGRFIAVTKQFLDPVIFTKGKRVTMAATVEGVETRKLGKGTYEYPIVNIQQLRYWQHESYYPYTYPYYYSSPRWYYGDDFDWPYDDYFWDWDYDNFGDGGFRHHRFEGGERFEGHGGEHGGFGEHGEHGRR
jgi:outer membrane lipoprotein